MVHNYRVTFQPPPSCLSYDGIYLAPKFHSEAFTMESQLSHLTNFITQFSKYYQQLEVHGSFTRRNLLVGMIGPSYSICVTPAGMPLCIVTEEQINQPTNGTGCEHYSVVQKLKFWSISTSAAKWIMHKWSSVNFGQFWRRPFVGADD